MHFSRRSFLAGCSALVAASAWPQAATRLNPKKGLAGAAPANSGLITDWYYNWRDKPSDKGIPATDPAMRFLPMCWGWNPDTSPSILTELRSQHPPTLLGFNEPDKENQSNIPVETALDAWPQFEGIASELVSPACANPLGDWMQRFMQGTEKRKLRIDSIGYHHYGPPSPDEFLSHLHKAYDLYQRPIWVTEFAVADWQAKNPEVPNRYSVDETAAFMQSVCTAMNKIECIRGYAWFPTGGRFARKQEAKGPLATSLLFEPDGRLNALGKLYAEL